MELSVATWNLQGRDPTDAGMEALVARFQPDVLLLQEADGPALAACAALADRPHRVMRADAGYRPGMAIMSRFEVRQSGQVTDPTGHHVRARLIWANLNLEGADELIVGSMHAAAPIGDPRSDNPWRRAVHLRAVAAFATGLRSAGTPAVLGGDSNALRYAIPGYQDASDGNAAPTWRPIGGVAWLPAIARLDRILVSPHFAVIETATPCRLSRSDHCPVVTRLRIRGMDASVRLQTSHNSHLRK